MYPIYALEIRQAIRLLFPGLCLLPLLAYSQSHSASYDYAQFRFPDINRKALDFSGSLFGSASGSRLQHSAFNSDRNSVNQDLLVSWSQFVNRDKLQALRQVNVSTFYILQKFREGDSTLYRNFWFEPQIQTGAVNRYYLNPTRYFELGWNAGASFRDVNYQQFPASPIAERQKRYGYSVAVPLRYGIGRIEPIDDIFIAKFTMDDMLQNGVLGAPIAQEALFELGRVMAHARNQRIFDFRRRRIYELSQIHTWFKEQGLAKDGDIAYFTTLADNWLYSFFNTRFAGKRFSVGITPSVNYSARPLERPQVSSGALFSATFEKQRPVNQFWQVDQDLVFYTGISHATPFFVSDRGRTTISTGLNAGFSAGYYPNSRTRLNAQARLSPEYRVAASPLLPAGQGDQISVWSSFSVQADYFINFRTRLGFHIGGQHIWNTEVRTPNLNNLSTFTLDGGARLIYSMF